MTALMFYTVAAFGFVYIVGHSVITRGLRVWIAGEVDANGVPLGVWRRWIVALVECPACLGFWFGLGAGFASGDLASPFTLALYTSGANYILGRMTGLME